MGKNIDGKNHRWKIIDGKKHRLKRSYNIIDGNILDEKNIEHHRWEKS